MREVYIMHTTCMCCCDDACPGCGATDGLVIDERELAEVGSGATGCANRHKNPDIVASSAQQVCIMHYIPQGIEAELACG